MAERHSRILAELSELGLTLARDLQSRALAAETQETAADLGRAFHAVSRSVRQTLALEAKLQRDHLRHGREDRDEARQESKRRSDKRRTQLRATMERLIWTKAEGEEAERLIDELEILLDEDQLSDDFTADPVELHIARICEQLGVIHAQPQDPPPGRSPIRGRWPAGPEGFESHSPLSPSTIQPP
jgi:hypothetical protein